MNVSDSYWLEEYFLIIPLDDLSTDDANVAYFVSGYIGCSISQRRKCLSCKILLIESNSTKQLEIANHARLLVPTQLSFFVTILIVQNYYTLMSNNNLKTIFYGINQCSIFLCAVRKTVATTTFNDAIFQTCTAGHANFDLIVITALLKTN